MALRPTRPDPSRRAERGTTLVESLVACVFAAIAAVGAGQAAQQLRQHGDLARQRSEALRLADAALEATRHAAASASGADRGLVDETRDVAGVNARYRVQRSAAVAPGASHVALAVVWADRTGAAQSIRLDTAVAGHDPSYSAALALASGPPSVALPYARAAQVPPAAVSIAGHRSVWRPAPGAARDTAIVFDDATGDAVAVCPDGARPPVERGDALAGCTRGRWQVAAGTLRVDGALAPVTVGLVLEGGRYPAPAMCSSDAMKTVRLPAEGGAWRVASVAVDALPASLSARSWIDTGERFVAWRCLVATRDNGAWSGRLEVAASGGGDVPLCRATGGDAAAAWRDVRASRTDLHLRAATAPGACPA